MGNTFYFDWEVQLMLWLQAHLGDFGMKLVSLFSAFGEEMLLILVMGFCYWCWNKELGVFIGTNFCVSSVWNTMIKNVALRRRPYMDTPVRCMRPVDPSEPIDNIAAQGFSFPSGHSTGAVATYGSIGAFVKKNWAWAIAIVIPLLVGVSRFCVGVHYPTDVLCGWLLGVLSILIVSVIGRRFKHKWAFYLLIVATALPGFFYCRTDDYYTSFGMMIGFFAGNLFEERYVNFKSTRVWWKIILRLIGGVAIYFLLNEVLKLPFDKAFLKSGTFAAYLVRTVRYAIVLFVDIAIYPMLFDRIGAKKPEPVEDAAAEEEIGAKAAE